MKTKAGPKQTSPSKRRKKGPRTVVTITAAQGAVEVRVKERVQGRGSRYFAEYQDPVRGRRRPSLHTDDLEEARARAQAIADKLAALEASLGGNHPIRSHHSDVTLGELCDLYRVLRLPRFVQQGRPTGYYVTLERVMRVAEALLGRDLIVIEIDQRHVDRFAIRRGAGGFNVSPRILPGGTPRAAYGAPERTLGPCSARTVRRELKLLSVILNWGARHRVAGAGTRLIPFNPFGDVVLPRGGELRRRRRRHQPPPPYAPATDESGLQPSERLLENAYAALLQLASGTGRRLEDILHLRIRDLPSTAAEDLNAAHAQEDDA